VGQAPEFANENQKNRGEKSPDDLEKGKKFVAKMVEKGLKNDINIKFKMDGIKTICQDIKNEKQKVSILII
jgi:hypothetical protein